MSELFLFIATKTTADPVIPPRSLDLGRRVSNAFRASAGGRLTVGDLKLRPNGSAIPGHLLCNGDAVSRISFPELFGFLGVSEGPGNGTTTFNLPDYLGVPLEVPPTAPAQTVTESGTVESDEVITEPTAPGETGGTEGGNVQTGGRPRPNEP